MSEKAEINDDEIRKNADLFKPNAAPAALKVLRRIAKDSEAEGDAEMNTITSDADVYGFCD